MIAVEQLRQLLRYEPDTGRLFWLRRDVGLFHETEGRTARNAFGIWNSRYAGKEAFTADDGLGYKCGRVFGQKLKAHQVIWAIFHGVWPDDFIDHINGIRSDNRIANLRVVTRAENAKNSRESARNKSGATGVGWHARDGVWAARIRVDGHLIHLGTFKDFDAAVAARKEAERRHGFHQNHGRKAS